MVGKNGGGGVGISGVVGKNVKCEHSNVVINVAYSKLRLQLHFRITFCFVVVSTDFEKLISGGVGVRAGGGGGRVGKIWKIY